MFLVWVNEGLEPRVHVLAAFQVPKKANPSLQASNDMMHQKELERDMRLKY